MTKVKSAEWGVNNPCKLQFLWINLSQSHYSAPWTWLKRKALLFGSPPSSFRNLVLLYINMVFKMSWLSISTGNHCTFPLLVLMVQSSPLNMSVMPYKGGFPSIQHDEIRDSTVNLLTEVCNELELLLPMMVKCSLVLPHTLRMVDNCILLLMVFGVVDSNIHFFDVSF